MQGLLSEQKGGIIVGIGVGLILALIIYFCYDNFLLPHRKNRFIVPVDSVNFQGLAKGKLKMDQL